MNNFISNDSKDFEYLRFGHRRERRNEKSTIYYFLQKKDGSKYSLFAVVFSPTITKELRNKEFPYLRIKVNRLTGETYFVFSKEKCNDSLSTSNFNAPGRLSVANKNLVSFVMKMFGINASDRVICGIEISPNRSQIDDVLVYKLLGAEK